MAGLRGFVYGVALLGLTGCNGNAEVNDLQAYMDEVRARPTGSIEALPRFQPYEAFTYRAAALRSPFQPLVKLDLQAHQKGSQEIRPDELRVKEFLESFNIEVFAMVGTLSRAGVDFALVSGTGGVYRVKVGDYLGRNYGRILAINEATIDVMEIVPDGDGGWLERPRSLPLKERS